MKASRQTVNRRVGCLIVVALAALSAACGHSPSPNPVRNGTMEEWPDGPDGSPADWTISGAVQVARSTRIRHGGRSAIRVAAGTTNATIQQSLSGASATDDHVLSCSAWVNTAHTRARLRVGGGRAFARSLFHPSDGRWYRLTTRLPSAEPQVDVAVELSATASPSEDDDQSATYIDDVECHALERTTSTSVALFVGDVWDWTWLHLPNYWTFRSEKGGWAYPLIRTFDARALLVFIEAAALAALLLWLTDGPFRLPIWVAVVIWLAGGWEIQRIIGALAPDNLGSLIQSDTANAFYSPTLHYSFREFLSQYLTLPLERHARTNMPGKVMFFYALRWLSDSPQVMAYLLILLSNLGGLLVFAIGRKLFHDDRVALYSMVFYLLIPARICFFPLLNTVTPVFLLLAFYFWLLFLESKHILYLAALGASLYWLLLFDPIPFALGLVFAAFLVAKWKDHRLKRSDLVAVVLLVVGAFLVVHLCALWFLDFNIVRAFQAVVRINSDFNLGRPYAIWVFGDLWEFFMSAGMVQSIMVLAFGALVLKRLASAADARERTSILLTPIHVLLLSYLASIFILDLLGLNRGETMRMWTFLTVFMAVIAAYLCALKLPRAATYLTVGVTLFQTTATIYTVGVVLH